MTFGMSVQLGCVSSPIGIQAEQMGNVGLPHHLATEVIGDRWSMVVLATASALKAESLERQDKQSWPSTNR